MIFFFKILNKLYIINKHNINKILYFKKIYLFEIIYLWNTFKNNNLVILEKFKRKKYQTKQFIKYCKNFIKIKYKKLKKFFNFLKFLLNIKYKYLINKKFIYKSYNFIKPSITIKKIRLLSYITWITNFGKIFFRIPNIFKIRFNYKIGNSFINSKNKFKFILYVKYSKLILKKILNFSNIFFNIILFNFKFNFGLSYNILVLKNNLNILEDYFFINIQIYLKYFLIFLKNFLNKLIYSNSFNNLFYIKKFNIYDKIFFSYIFFLNKIKLFYFV